MKLQKDRDFIKIKIKELKSDDKKRFKLLLEQSVKLKKKVKV